jgi:threonine synthase
MNYARALVCRSCGHHCSENKFKLTCPNCDSPLELSYDLDGICRYLKRGWPQPNGATLLKQWKALLPPISQAGLITKCSLGETQTPLIRANAAGAKMGLKELRFKIEIGPTLSLKDRGSSLCSLKALEMGFEAMCVASSGNNAGSVAAYAARAGLPAIVFVQRDAAPAKFAKMLAYGARVVRVNGDLSAASRLCGQMREQRGWMESGGPNPYRITAKRLVAYEIFAQMGFEVPDAVVFPCGGCAGIVAAYSGFRELMTMGLIAGMPRLIGVQLTACDPVTRAFEQGLSELTPVVKQPTISDALTNANPYWGARAIAAVRDTDGLFISISDEEMDRMRVELGAKEGLFLEPAGAASAAGLYKALNENRIQGLERVVCTLTGHGLNASTLTPRSPLVPELIPPDPAAVEAYLGL